jgi:uncharacterized protein YjgD (DUF1641 family)
MGGIIRCIKNDYNLDEIENEINKTDEDTVFDEIFQDIKNKNNIYIDFDKNETSHYAENKLVDKNINQRSNTFCLFPKENKLPKL